MNSPSQPAYRAIRKKLFISCASIALATAALSPQKARAQAAPGAFQGDPTTGSGTVVYSRITNPVVGSETITIGSDTATINWAPYDTTTGTTDPINFLPSGDTATFTSTSGVTDYTVLNRIVPTDPNRAIELNGTILSTLEGGNTTGGRIWFYSPGGILIGAGAVIDVGSLLLTTADPDSWSVNADGSFDISVGHGNVATNPTSKISIADTATIHALQQNSYVALIAPRIEQAGTVEVNGSAAYIAGEAMTMSFSQGLFDVAVDVGTGDVNGIVHTGTTGGPANVTAGDNHSIYMAAVPKNQAMTMLLGGNIGFDAATDASVQNGQIILSSGWAPTGCSQCWQTPDTTSNAAMIITGGHFTSSVDALANSDLKAETDDGDLTFDSDVTLYSYNAGVTLSATSGNTLSIGGNVVLAAEGHGSEGQAINLDASGGGILDIAGTTFLQADQFPGVEVYGTDTFAGTVNIAANGGTISTGDLTIDVSAQGGPGNADNAAGAGYGGTININADGGGSVTVDGTLNANAAGVGGASFTDGVSGGTGYGGTVNISVTDGSIDFTGESLVEAIGIGGSYEGFFTPTSQQGGTGQGGGIFVSSNGPGTITFGSVTNLDADGEGGEGQSGGAGYGGDSEIYGYDGTIDLGTSAFISASGIGGAAGFGLGGDGGLGQGGVVKIGAWENSELGTAVTIKGSSLLLTSIGLGGTGGAGNGDSIAPGTGGEGDGGRAHQIVETFSPGGISVEVQGPASLNFDLVIAESEGDGGAGGAGVNGQTGGLGGAGYGGSADFSYSDPFGTGVGSGGVNVGTLDLETRGFGGAGGTSDTGTQGDGGLGSGGFADLSVTTGMLNLGNLTLEASGLGGQGATGGEGSGGDAELLIDGGGITDTGSLGVFAQGQGGSGTVQGGDGSGGYAYIAFSTGEGQSLGGSLDVTGDIILSASGIGGAGMDNSSGAGGIGGAGFGGSAEFFATDFLADGATITVNAGSISLGAAGDGGFGGGGVTGGSGGEGSGGSAYAEFYGGTITAGSIEANSAGAGGGGGAGSDGAGGTGGDGSGGYSEVDIGTKVTADVQSVAWAFGGQGGAGTLTGDGGSGFGGTATFNIFPTGQLIGAADVNTSASGGDGANGGEGDGGDSELLIQGSLNGSHIGIFAGGTGGNGTSGNGGYSSGGTSDLLIDGGQASVSGNVQVLADGNPDPDGDGIGIGGSGSVNGGDSDGGSAKIEIMPTGGSLTVGGETDIYAIGVGGVGGPNGDGSGGNGGYGRGGEADFLVDACTSTCTINVAIQDLVLRAPGWGGNGGNSTLGGSAGEGDGGTTDIDIEQGSVSIGNIIAHANGFGGVGGIGSNGQGGAGGSATGGANDFTLASGASIDASTYLGTANALGGLGGTGTTSDGDGGSAQSGTNNAVIDGDATFGGSLGADPTSTGFVMTAYAQGGDGANGGSATSGTTSITIGGSLTTTGIFEAAAQAGGGAGSTGAGGSATGGTASVDVNGSLGAAAIYVGTIAAGGNGATDGGSASGGSASVNVNGGSLNISDFGSSVDADATGGTASGGPTGSATAGNASVASFNGGDINAVSLIIEAQGDAGTGSVEVSAGSNCDCSPGTINAGDLSLFSSNNINVPTIGTNITVDGRLSVNRFSTSPLETRA